MASDGRNGPCTCGSGMKAKRCCGVRRGPGPEELAKAYLAEQRPWAARRLRGIDREELVDLLDAIVDLPELDLSLQVDLPSLLTPDWQRACALFADDAPHDDIDSVLDPLVRQLDTPTRRAVLARAVRSLEATGRIDTDVAAVAVADLNMDDSTLIRASVAEAIAVSAGTTRTPAGLVLAAR